MGSICLSGSSTGADPIEHLLPLSYCTGLLASTVMGPSVGWSWEEDEDDAGNTGALVSGHVFTIHFLPGHGCAVKPLTVLSVKAVSSLGDLGLEFGKGLGRT